MEDGEHKVQVKPYTCQGPEGFTVLERRVRNWVGIQLHLPKQAGLYLMSVGLWTALVSLTEVVLLWISEHLVSAVRKRLHCEVSLGKGREPMGCHSGVCQH